MIVYKWHHVMLKTFRFELRVTTLTAELSICSATLGWHWTSMTDEINTGKSCVTKKEQIIEINIVNCLAWTRTVHFGTVSKYCWLLLKLVNFDFSICKTLYFDTLRITVRSWKIICLQCNEYLYFLLKYSCWVLRTALVSSPRPSLIQSFTCSYWLVHVL